MCVHACIRRARMGHGGPVITIRGSGLLCVCVQGCVLCFLVMSLHAALITGCPKFLSLFPLFLCVSAILSLVTEFL